MTTGRRFWIGNVSVARHAYSRVPKPACSCCQASSTRSPGPVSPPRLADGSPIPIGELRLLARDADILPSIFDAKTQNMWLGRQRRTASEAQRVALMARDEGCVCCKANPLWCRAHHIIWWSKDGSTDLDNLLLVCDDCHKKIHLHGWTVHQHPKTRKYYLKPPNPDGINPTPQDATQPARPGKNNTVATRSPGGSTGSHQQNNPTPTGANRPARSRDDQQRRKPGPTREIREGQPARTDRRDPGKDDSGANQPNRREQPNPNRR